MRVLIITPRLNRSGSSTYLLKLISSTVFSNTAISTAVVVLRPELELFNQFKLFSRVIVFRKSSRFFIVRYIHRLKVEFKLKVAIANSDVVFFNSIESLTLLNKFNLTGKKLIFHCHEMPQNIDLEWPWFNNFNRLDLFDVIISDTDSSMSLMKLLYNSNKFNKVKFKVVRPIINLNEVKFYPDSINENFTVGNLATQYLGKGVDLFVLTAIQYCLRYPNDSVFFEFLGPETSELSKTLRNDIVKAGLENKIILGREVANPDEFYKNMSLFFLSSRTESYSTSMLEAASFGVPVICFNASGESHDFVKCVQENVIDYMNIDSVIGRIRSYYLDRASLKRDGEIMRNYLDKPGVVGTAEEIVDLILN